MIIDYILQASYKGKFSRCIPIQTNQLTNEQLQAEVFPVDLLKPLSAFNGFGIEQQFFQRG
ncbi:hypothetical protein [Nostoc sp. LEGE 12450]|uniref:hypothetical protein n=1 Tax=Nostoc sp. LEGE 12450 TaxID=1828643 RepID=UPI001881B77F|nr:hypothetical protein [Nostoc sp. LEGE 12450]MBE8989949.1 hypothetical protein [Nostoc sp. LEGE 12450]